jgi:hypothetical protein
MALCGTPGDAVLRRICPAGQSRRPCCCPHMSRALAVESAREVNSRSEMGSLRTRFVLSNPESCPTQVAEKVVSDLDERGHNTGSSY